MKIYYIITIILFFLARVNLNFSEDLFFFRIIFIILYLMTLIFSWKRLNKNKIIFFFLITLFLFQYGRIIFIPLITKEAVEMTWFSFYKISNETLKEMCEILLYNLFGIKISIILYSLRKKNKIQKFIFQKEKIEKIIRFLAVITIPFFIYANINILKKVDQIGYASMYKFGTNVFKDNIVIKILSGINYSATILGIVLIPKKNRAYLFGILFIIQSFMISLRGSRAQLLTIVLFLLWYYSFFYCLKIDLKKIVFISIFGIIFSELMLIKRAEANYKREFTSVIETGLDFMRDQGVTGTFISTVKDKSELYTSQHRKMPYIFTSIFGEKYSSQNELIYDKVMKSKNSELSFKMSAILNKSRFVQGYGIGGNYILEMYDFGKKAGVFILSMLHVYAVLYLCENFEKFNIILRTLIFTYFFNLMRVPRWNYFNFDAGIVIRVGILYFIIISFITIITTILNSNNQYKKMIYKKL